MEVTQADTEENLKPLERGVTIEQAFEKTGGSGRFQKL
jgi:hypothetical protein